MRLNKPSPKTMHEYLLSMGEDWIKEIFTITGDDIDNILYGAVLPTPDRQDKKVKRAFKKDRESQAFMNKMYKDDHFIWDKPRKTHIRCQTSGEIKKLKPSEDFLEKWEKIYIEFMAWDMKKNGHGMKAYGWSFGERIINKVSSKTSDDDIQDRFLMYLEKVILPKQKFIKSDLNSLSKKTSGCSGKGNESQIIEKLESFQ